jgi:hypothetical protein
MDGLKKTVAEDMYANMVNWVNAHNPIEEFPTYFDVVIVPDFNACVNDINVHCFCRISPYNDRITISTIWNYTLIACELICDTHEIRVIYMQL